MKVLAWDTETALFGPGRQAPALSCVSWMQEGAVGLLDRKECLPWFKQKLSDPEIVLVGHNVAYDTAVIGAEHPELIPLIFKAYRESRITDTMLRQMLLDNAAGMFRGYWKEWKDKDGRLTEKFVPLNYTLDSCYFRATKKRLDKDTWRLRYGELRDIPIHDWPEGAQRYPKDDARATMAVYENQEKTCEKTARAYQRFYPHVEDPKPLADEFAQARAAWWMQLMRVWGIRTNPDRVDEVEAAVTEEIKKLEAGLISAGLVREDGSRNIKAAQARMVGVRGEDNCRKTKKGRIQLDEDACKESGDLLLMDYAEVSSLRAVVAKDLPALRQGRDMPIHSNFSSFVATGRTSSSSPNIQNIRRLPGIRECFVPRPGKVFLDADYDGLELRTLAQACLNLVGKSKLAEVLNSGKDAHLMVAAQILRISYEEALERKRAGDEEVDNARQTAKVANFGFPGGLGFETFVVYAKKGYGVVITEDEARSLKRAWFKAFPEMEKYFDLIDRYSKANPEDEGRVSLEQLYTKRLRGDISYTAACNSFFQGLGADATKAAGFLLAYECYVDKSSPLFGARIVNYIHDQFLVEVDEDKCHEAAWRLARVMEEGAAPFLPDVKATVSEPMAARCWSKKVKQVFDDNGRLIPWDMEFEVKQRAG